MPWGRHFLLRRRAGHPGRRRPLALLRRRFLPAAQEAAEKPRLLLLRLLLRCRRWGRDLGRRHSWAKSERRRRRCR